MIIGFTGLELPQGKIKYKDLKLTALAEKDNPKKISPYFFEFILEDFTKSFAIVVPKDKILDILINDMEIIENRIQHYTYLDKEKFLSLIYKNKDIYKQLYILSDLVKKSITSPIFLIWDLNKCSSSDKW